MCVPIKMVKLWIESTKKLTVPGFSKECQGNSRVKVLS
jgi:hypothetical protein